MRRVWIVGVAVKYIGRKYWKLLVSHLKGSRNTASLESIG